MDERYKVVDVLKSPKGEMLIIRDKIQKVGFMVDISKTPYQLYRIINQASSRVNVVIPKSILGFEISALSSVVTTGKFEKIIISNGIKVCVSSFAYSEVNEVVWPNDEPEIPALCFYNSKVKTLTNIQNVTAVRTQAFKSSKIEKLDLSNSNAKFDEGALCGLPDKCDLIPPYYISKEEWEKVIRNLGG